MTRQQLLERTKVQRIGKVPVVVLPLEYFESMKEDLAMYQSKTLARQIKKAREEIKKGKALTFAEVKKKLGLK